MLQWLRKLRLHRVQSGRETDLPDTLRRTVETLTRRLNELGVAHALIGGVAVSLHGSLRATKDIDLLVDSAAGDRVDELMLELGFERLARGKVFGNYLLGSLRVDVLFSQGQHTRDMLRRAQVVELRHHSTKLARPEDLIGLKLQALANSPERVRDRFDIEALLRRFEAQMDMQLVREYFTLFGKEAELDALLQAIRRGRP